tara:strand:+ start:751 stop:1395 length:645 start_codon:yes stop_codon:yes gene_type:complete
MENTYSINAKGKLTTKTASAFTEIFGDADIVKPLREFNGIVMPYNPLLNIQYDANYSTQQPLHSNFQYPFYQNSAFAAFSASFVLTSNTQKEARYTLACHHFLRTCTKMVQSGSKDFSTADKTGSPPPVLKFSAYGDQMYKDVPVVITSYNFTMENDKIMINVIDEGGRKTEVYVPVEWTMIIQLQPAYNPKENRKKFSTADYANGKLISGGYQ